MNLSITMLTILVLAFRLATNVIKALDTFNGHPPTRVCGGLLHL